MPTELPHAYLSDLVTNVRQDGRYHGFQGLLLVTTRLVFEQTLLRTGNQIVTLRISLLNHGVLLAEKHRSRDDIVDTKREPIVG